MPFSTQALKQRLNLRIPIPARGLFLEDQIGSHAAAREILDAAIVFGSIGVGIEVSGTLVSHVFKKFNQPERGLRIRGAKAEVLVITSGHLVVEIDVEQLAC